MRRDNSTSGVTIGVIICIVCIMVALLVFGVHRGKRLHITGQGTARTQEAAERRRIQRLMEVTSAKPYRDICAERMAQLGDAFEMNRLCTICLKGISDLAYVRGLQCQHTFHQFCLDRWYSTSNDFCPLCHHPIIPQSEEEDIVGGQITSTRPAQVEAPPRYEDIDSTTPAQPQPSNGATGAR